MIYLDNNKKNDVYLSLPKTSGSTYIFKIVDDVTYTATTFLLPQITGATDVRYQHFEFTLSGSTNVNLTGGTIYLNNRNNYTLYYGYTNATGLTFDNVIDYKVYKVNIDFGDIVTTSNPLTSNKTFNNITVNKKYNS